MWRKNQAPFLWVGALTLLLLVGQSLPEVRFFAVPANYLPLHSGLEFVAMAVSIMVFALAWNLRRQPDNSHLMMLGVGFLAVSLIDFAHTLSYAGMPTWITPSGSEKAINFWLAGRFLAAGVFLAVALRPLTHWSENVCRIALLAALGLALGIGWVGLAQADRLPHTFIQGSGLTRFKVGSEYVLMGLYGTAALLLFLKKKRSVHSDGQWLAGAAWVQALAEMFFTLYADVTDLFNLLGHVYKALAYLMVYRALFSEGVQAPYRKLQESSDTLLGILKTTRDGFWRFDNTGRLQEVNPTYCQQSGYTREELLGLHIFDLEAQESRADTEKHIQRIAAAGSEIFESRHRRKDGSVWHVEVSASHYKNASEPFFAFLRDITARNQALEALNQLTQLLKETEQIGKVGGWEVNIDTLIQTWTHEVYAIHEVENTYQPNVEKGVSFYTPASRPVVEQAVQQAIEHGKPFDVELEIITAKGHVRSVHVIGKPDLSHRRVHGFIQDITEHKQMENKVRQMAFYDTLTQLPNRRLLVDRLNQTMAASKRSGHYAALMFLDLDNFKPLNDQHGHGAGDLLLIEVAKRLTSCVREMDTVSRFGGDEFVVMLSELVADKDESISQACVVAEKIRTLLSEPYRLKVPSVDGTGGDVVHHCSACIGVVLFVNHEASQDELLKWADAAMYQAKKSGRNSIRFHKAKG